MDTFLLKEFDKNLSSYYSKTSMCDISCETTEAASLRSMRLELNIWDTLYKKIERYRSDLICDPSSSPFFLQDIIHQ